MQLLIALAARLNNLVGKGGNSMHRLILALVLAVAPVMATAQDRPAGADGISIELENAHEDELGQAFDLLQAGKPAEAVRKFDSVIAAYEAEQQGKTVRCAESLEQAMAVSLLLMSESSVDGEVTILGRNWCAALFGKGYALIDLRRSNDAEPFLLRATLMAPLEAHYVNELAELYKNRRQWQLAYDTFERALELADTPSTATPPQVKARSLRGMGFAMIELGDLDKAVELFHRSQEFDPGSAAAKSELEYIASLRAGKS